MLEAANWFSPRVSCDITSRTQPYPCVLSLVLAVHRVQVMSAGPIEGDAMSAEVSGPVEVVSCSFFCSVMSLCRGSFNITMGLDEDSYAGRRAGVLAWYVTLR